MLYALFLSQVAQSPNVPSNKLFIERTQAPTTSGQMLSYQFPREVDQPTIVENDFIENRQSILPDIVKSAKQRQRLDSEAMHLPIRFS